MWRERLHRRQRRDDRFLKWGKIFLLLSVVFLLVIIVGVPLFSLLLPSPEKIVRNEGYSTKILDRNGLPLYDIYETKRQTPVLWADVPDALKKATIAIEDKNFYKHGGFDIWGMVRGTLRCFVGRCQGGSTLTQQLVKNVLLTSERSLWRKVKEFILSVQIEKKYKKDEILLMYLNEAPYGGTIWGVESASETYFGKKVKDLTLVESAILAGIPQRPSLYSPYSSDPKAYTARTTNVLRRMKEDGYLTGEEEAKAVKELGNVIFQEKGSSFKAPHFVMYVEKILEQKYGTDAVERGGLTVTTTLDLTLQEEAQKTVYEEIKKVEYLNITNGSAVVVDPTTGEILAMVGSKQFDDPNYDGQVNVALALRQPGSSFKPFTYVTALKKGFTPSSLLVDAPTEFPGGVDKPPYIPVNYDGKFRGPVQLRFALANSINIPAVKLLALVGIKDVLSTAYEMGVTSLPPTDETLKRVGLSLTLGGGEVRLLDLTGAYGPFMNGGFRIDPVTILKVVDSKGKVIEENTPKLGKRVLDEEDAYLIANILSDNEARKEVFGPNSLLNIPGKMVAVKTGTTNDRRDNWTIGGTKHAVVGVWVGNNDNTPMKQVASGVSGASPIWRKIMTLTFKNKTGFSFDTPSNVVTANVDVISGFRAHDGYPERLEYFKKGTEPGDDPVHKKIKVCKSDGKLASPADVSSGNYDDREFIYLKEEDPTSAVGGPNKWQEGILNWIGTQTDDRYRPPTDYCGSSNPLSINFVNPGDHSSNLDNKFTIEFRVESTSGINEAELFIDGSRIRGFTSAPFRYEITNPLSDGVHEIKVTAKDANGNSADKTIKVGVKVNWDYVPATPTPISTPSPSPTPTLPTL